MESMKKDVYICSCLKRPFKHLLNVYKGFSDIKSLRTGRMDINIYMQNLHLFYTVFLLW